MQLIDKYYHSAVVTIDKIVKFQQNFAQYQMKARTNKKLHKAIVQAEQYLYKRGVICELKRKQIRRPSKAQSIMSDYNDSDCDSIKSNQQPQIKKYLIKKQYKQREESKKISIQSTIQHKNKSQNLENTLQMNKGQLNDKSVKKHKNLDKLLKQRQNQILKQKIIELSRNPEQLVQFLLKIDINDKNINEILNTEVVNKIKKVENSQAKLLYKRLKQKLISKYFKSQKNINSKAHQKEFINSTQNKQIIKNTIQNLAKYLKICYSFNKHLSKDLALEIQSIFRSKDPSLQRKYKFIVLQTLKILKVSINWILNLEWKITNQFNHLKDQTRRNYIVKQHKIRPDIMMIFKINILFTRILFIQSMLLSSFLYL